MIDNKVMELNNSFRDGDFETGEHILRSIFDHFKPSGAAHTFTSATSVVNEINSRLHDTYRLALQRFKEERSKHLFLTLAVVLQDAGEEMVLHTYELHQI